MRQEPEKWDRTPIQIAYERMNALDKSKHPDRKQAEREFWELVKDAGVVKGNWWRE